MSDDADRLRLAHLTHVAQMLTAGFVKSIHSQIPREFIVEVPYQPDGEPETILLYRERVVDIIDSGTMLSSAIAQQMLCADMNKQSRELRLRTYESYILVVAIELIGPKQ